MKASLFRGGLAALLVAFGGCAKNPGTGPTASVNLVAEPERSPHFGAVGSHLELGGTVYGYIDVDGDALLLAGQTQVFLGQLATSVPAVGPYAKQDFKALFSELGFTDMKAAGISSVKETNGMYRNRAFFYMPDGRHGLFAIFGGPSGAFSNPSLAPSDTDLYYETEFDLRAVYETVKVIVGRVNGPEAVATFEKSLKDAGVQSGFSTLDIINGLKGRATFILRFDPAKTVAIPLKGPKAFNVPAFSCLVCVDGIGTSLEGALQKQSGLEKSADGSVHIYTVSAKLPVDGLQPVVAVDGSRLFVATTGDFLKECLHRTDGLDTNPAFKSKLAFEGGQGNGLTWVSPRFAERLRALSAINPEAAPDQKRALDMILSSVPALSEPIISVRSNLPDGILVSSYSNRSLKADLAMVAVYNPVTVGLLAAMAIPAFEKVRENSRTQGVLSNLRLLNGAAEQYYRVNAVTTTTYDQLVGPGKLVPAINPVAGEDYRTLVFIQGDPLRLRMPNGQVYSYPFGRPGAKPSRRAERPVEQVPAKVSAQTEGITENLKVLNEAANQYYIDHDTTTTTYDQLVGSDKAVPSITPVGDEDYRYLLFKKGRPLHLHLKDGQIISYPPPK